MIALFTNLFFLFSIWPLLVKLAEAAISIVS